MLTPVSSITITSVDQFIREQTQDDIDFRKDTCAIIGTTYKGPAFVPKSFISIGEERPAIVRNSLNTFARYYGNPTGSFNVTSNAKLAAEQWLTGENKQVSFIRILGTGDGKKTNSRGIVEKAGFIVGDEQVSGSLNHGKLSRNTYANEGGPLGKTFFLGGFYYQQTGSIDNNVILHPLSESFDQCRMTSINGIDKKLTSDVNGKKIYPIINGILMFPSGVYPGLNVEDASATLEGNEVAKGFFGVGGDKGQHVGSGSLTEDDDRIFSLFLNGYNIANTSKIDFNFNKNNSTYYYQNVFNTDPLKIEEKGHLLYSAYDPSHSFHGGLKHLESGYTTFILSSSLERNLSNTNSPNYEDFRARYRTAASPWIVSQTFAVQNNDRTNITGSIRNLFKFYSRSDGHVGNSEVYMIVHPKELGILSGKNTVDPGKNYSKFDIFVVDYSSNRILEKYINCNLHPRSKDYVGKKIGTIYEYYNFETEIEKQKIVSKGKYLNQSQYIRLELHEDVEDLKVPATTMPSGFRGYRHIATEYGGTGLLTDIQSFSNDDGDTINSTIFDQKVLQCPVPLTIQLKTKENDTFSPDVPDLNESGIGFKIDKPIWGVNKNFSYNYSYLLDNDKQLDLINTPNIIIKKHYQNSDQVRTVSKNLFDFSLFLPDAQQDGLPASWDKSSEDSGLDADLYNNNLFHLEKIIVHTGSSGVNKDCINWNLSTYRRDGKNLSSIQSNTLMHSHFANYLNINADLNTYSSFDAERSKLERIAAKNAKHLAFSVYLAGGFDGVNIFDADKSKFTSDACVREENNELLNNDLDGPTIISYKRAANLIKDENLLFRDIVCIPGIESNTIRKNSAVLASEEKTYLYVQDIPLSNFNYEIVTGSKKQFLDNFASDAGRENIVNQDEVIVKNTAEMHRRQFYFSSFNASYFGDIETTLLRGEIGQTKKIISPSINALGTIARTSIGKSPSGKELNVGDAPVTIIKNFDDRRNNSDTFRELYRSRDINTVAQKSGVLTITAARTEDDAKPSLAGAIGTRRARSEIRKRIRDMTIRSFLFENYSTRLEPFVIEYDRRITRILQQYVNEGVLESYETNIDTRNMSAEDVRDGILRGSVKLRFVGRDDIYGLSDSESEIRLDDIIGTFERLVN